eukprot:3469034-Pleurochrysis_carterae.AAC.2
MREQRQIRSGGECGQAGEDRVVALGRGKKVRGGIRTGMMRCSVLSEEMRSRRGAARTRAVASVDTRCPAVASAAEPSSNQLGRARRKERLCRR